MLLHEIFTRTVLSWWGIRMSCTSGHRGFESAYINFMLLYQLPERPAVFLGHPRGFSYISFAGMQQALNVVLLEPGNLLGLGLL